MHYFEREIIGWLCLLAGNFFIAKSVIGRRDRGQMRELLGLPIDKVKRFRNFSLQRLERIVGFVFILVGVGLHLYVVVRKGQKELGINNPQEAVGQIFSYLAIGVVALLLIVALMHWITSAFSRKIFLENLGYLIVRQNYNLADDPDLMVRVGDILGEPRRADDTVESYTERLEAKLKLGEIRARLLEQGKLPPI